MMSLGSYTFPVNPSELDGMFTKKRLCASVDTYNSVGFFSWGVKMSGKKITLTWEYMSCTMYDALQALLEADAQVVFNPDLASAKTCNVEILDLDGTYFQTQGDTVDSETAYRTNVALELLIMSELA